MWGVQASKYQYGPIEYIELVVESNPDLTPNPNPPPHTTANRH